MEITEELVSSLAVNEVKILAAVAKELSIQPRQVSAVVSLVNEGCTVPFIARYRKEMHGSLDEVQVRDSAAKFQSGKNLEERRIEIIKGIYSQGKLNPELFDNINKAATLTELEDIYAPYKRKKKTRGMIAQEKGLDPLAEIMLSQTDAAVDKAAPGFVKEDAEHPELSVASAEEALQGARDIIAERVSQNPDNRALVKSTYLKTGSLEVKGLGDEEKKKVSVYQMYYEYSEPLSTLKPHRVLAINRGEREGELEASISVDEDLAVKALEDRIFPKTEHCRRAVEDGLKRLLSPAVIRELRSDATEDADKHGIGVFSSNLGNLLMQPPIKGTRVLALDPGIRTGTKCAALDETGKFLGHFLVRQDQKEETKKIFLAAIKRYGSKLVAVGNGTGSQEVRTLVAEVISESVPDVSYTVVDEDGASVYSASDIAREEFPELDLTIRGAISIGRRLQDPLAELVKIDPKSIGVGLYQHDVNQKALSDTLDDVVGSVVNRVGVNLNTASYALLKYVSGINSLTAKKLVKFRDEKGTIVSREELKNAPGMGPKTFEQCAGFLKIPESANPLDNTWVHPEQYALAEELFPLIKAGTAITHDMRAGLKQKYAVGDTTLDDIISELKKPNRDPREDFPMPVLQKDVLNFEDLREGMTIHGKIKNVVDFGAFVDLGIKESALLHVSEMADHFVGDPMEVLKVGDQREFRIISLDPDRKRIGVSLKKESSGSSGERSGSATGSRAGVPRTGQPAGAQSGGYPESSYGGFGGNKNDSSRGGSAARGGSASRGSPSKGGREDDGETYNPFAELLKKKK